MTYDWFNQACGSLWNTIFSEIRALAPDARLMRIREAADIACFIHGAGDSVKSGTSTLEFARMYLKGPGELRALLKRMNVNPDELRATSQILDDASKWLQGALQSHHKETMRQC